MTSNQSLTRNNKLVSAYSSTFGARTNNEQFKFTTLTMAPTWGKPPPSPYNILSVWPWDQHPNDILSWDSQMGVSKFSKLGTSTNLGPCNFLCRPPMRWGLEQNCSPCQKLFNGVSHAKCTQGNWAISTFSGRELNCQFDYRPFFWA
jgi:hypothetical protein